MIIGSAYIFRKDADSTNSYAAQLMQKGYISEGTIIYTNYQSAGRGQKQNTWESEDGKNLLFSIVLYPEFVKPEDQFIISMSVSLGVCDFLKSFIPVCRIKWPNDIYTGNDKIAGILIENSISENTLKSTIAGIGMNINQEKFSHDILNPVSLKILTGKEHNLDLCLKQIAYFLDKRYKQLLSGTWDEIRNEYRSYLYRLGEWQSYKTERGLLYGRIVSVSDTGCLMVEESRNKIHEFRFNDIDFII